MIWVYCLAVVGVTIIALSYMEHRKEIRMIRYQEMKLKIEAGIIDTEIIEL
jgi:uncharacterized membrane protein YjgN (DUF898 family)